MDEKTAAQILEQQPEGSNAANGNGSASRQFDDFVLDPAALRGLAGEIVQTIEPYSEADPATLLLNVLVAFGNTIGCSSHAVVNHDEHPGRLFVVQVGLSGKGRKGTGWKPIKYLFSKVDPEWSRERIKTGLSTGEGLIFNVRDPIYKQEPIKEKGRVIDYQQVLSDPGESDKRLLVIEPEFASTLTVMGREGNTLSAVMRQAWDDGDLSPLTRNNPIKSTGAHVSIIGHITQYELLARMDDTSKANGFANRFLWALVKRSKELSEGADVPDDLLENLKDKLDTAISFARQGGTVKRDGPARQAWADVYGPLSAGRPGLTGAILSRAEAQVLRLSVIYALLDSTRSISVEHLKAALAVWEYCEASAEAIFGTKLGDPVADRILEALRAAGTVGMSEKDIYEVFAGHLSPNERNRALMLIRDLGLARCETVPTAGRPKTVWWAAYKAYKAVLPVTPSTLSTHLSGGQMGKYLTRVERFKQDAARCDGDGEGLTPAHRVFAGQPAEEPVVDAAEGTMIAVLIDSPIVGPVWFAFDDNFKSGDDIPVFFTRELPFLRNMTEAEIRRRYDEKRALGSGWIRERNENPNLCWSCGATWSQTTDVAGNTIRVCWGCVKGHDKPDLPSEGGNKNEHP
jgi:uncharacterized protein DUF3987